MSGRRIETAVRQQRDIARLAKACGDDVLRREAQANITGLQDRYVGNSRGAGLAEQPQRMAVAGFRAVKSTEQLKCIAKSDIIITDKQLGKKAGRHTAEWNFDPASSEDRQKFLDIIKDIHRNADEVRRVPWLFDKDGKRTIEVNDVVLVDDNHLYITTMKDGIHNNRVKGGKRIES